MRSTAPLALLLLGACSIEFAPRPRPPSAPARSTSLGLEIVTTTLTGGLRVVKVRDPRATEVQVTMRYQVGAGADGAHPGLAHLVEHLMFQQDLGGQPIFTHLEDTATYFNAATTHDATTYVTRGPTAALDELLAIEVVRLEERCARLTEEAFTRERQVVLAEIEQRGQASEVYGALHAALYPEGHPYRRSLGGSIAGVSAITREQACAFADTYYAPNNAVLVVSGPLTHAEMDAALGRVAGRITRRTGAATRRSPAVVLRPQHLEVPAPIDEDILVLAWPLPVDPQLQANVRAVGSALPRLVDAQIAGVVTEIDLGDRDAPMYGLAVLPGDGETLQQAIDGTRRGIEMLPGVFRDGQPEDLDEVLFDRIQQGAIYQLYAGLEDGSGRDVELAAAALGGRDPRAAVADELAALRDLSRDDAADLAGTYFAINSPTVVTLKATPGRKRGDPVTLRAPVHDFGPRRTPADPALATRPAAPARDELPGARTRVLPNGLKVVLLPVTTVPTFEARLIFGAGTADEPEGVKGVSLLAAHTLTWDLHHLSDALAFVRAGGMRDTDVAADRTSFIVQGLDMNLDVVLAGLRRWVREGVYDDSAASFVNAMRLAAKRADDQGMLTDAWRASLFGSGHPYVKGGIVRHASPRLTLQDAHAFRVAYYTPDNATLVIAGRFDAALADRWIDFLFADWGGRAAPRRPVPVRTTASSIALVADTTLVQLRLAIPTAIEARAVRLVAAAMLAEIARDVRHRLGASYAIDAELAETRLASFYYVDGFVDAARAQAAVDLVAARIGELRSDPAAAARAFVVARNHVLSRLRSSIGSASALADRVERDVAMAREPMSDLATAAAVSSLTIADMTPALAELDLTRATVLMSGPATQLAPAFAALGRKPAYVRAPPAPAAGPGATAPPLMAYEQRVLRSDVAPALTSQPLPRLFVLASASTAVADAGDSSELFVGYSFTAAAGYRYGWTNAIGVQLEGGRFTADGTDAGGFPTSVTLVPLNALAIWHLAGQRRTWGDVLLGLHLEGLDGEWSAAPLAGLQGGVNLVGRLGLVLRWESTAESDADYYALSLGVAYRR